MKSDAPDLDAGRLLAPQPAYLLLIAYGNTLRRDDGAGLAFAEKIVERWRRCSIQVELLTTTQLAPELAANIAAEGVVGVIFVDSAFGQTSTDIEIGDVNIGNGSVRLGHHFTPAELLVYARMLYEAYTPAWLVTVPGFDYGHGEGLSRPVCGLLAQSANVIDQLLLEIEDRLSCMNLLLPRS
jgi:hydrogenase maturation protease